MSDHIVKPNEEVKPDKTFDFSKEEQDALQPRQLLVGQMRVQMADIQFFMQQYVANVVIPRLGINRDDYEVKFDVILNKVFCFKKPPEIIKPPGIVLPK